MTVERELKGRRVAVLAADGRASLVDLAHAAGQSAGTRQAAERQPMAKLLTELGR